MLSYLREVGFPDNVLEARVARIHLYRTLTNPKDDNAPSDTMVNNKPPIIILLLLLVLLHVCYSLMIIRFLLILDMFQMKVSL